MPDTIRGPVRFDEFGNVVGNAYIRKVEKKGGKYVNAVVKTYPDVSQFWTYKHGGVPEEPGLFARLSRRRRIWSNVSCEPLRSLRPPGGVRRAVSAR